MLKSSAQPVIRLRGVRHNNLKNFDLDLPLRKLIVITGLSGSGKSSLAFDTLFAEGQRRYIETFSPYARQFFDRMDKPQVDSIEGIPPAIAVEQRNAVRTTRSTVGTMTEICDYMKVLWPHVAQLHCRGCGRPVRQEPPGDIWEAMRRRQVSGEAGQDLLITFELPLSEKLSAVESLALVAKQGYQRLLVEGKVIRLDEAVQRSVTGSLVVVQDRIAPSETNRARFVEACEQAYHFGRGKLCLHSYIREAGGEGRARAIGRFSSRLHCAECDLDYQEPSPALFSYNHPLGACPTCRGFGRTISIDYKLALPDTNLTLAQGAIKPWRTGQSAECFLDLQRMCRELEIPMDVPFGKLPQKWQDLIIDGDPDYGKDEEHEWPRAWYGVKGFFRWLESKAYKMHVRVLLSRYRTYTPCSECGGQRFKPESLLYRVSGPQVTKAAAGLTIADFYRLPIRDALKFIAGLGSQPRYKKGGPLEVVTSEVRCRLEYLELAGLGYLSLDRPTRTLSGGETERVALTTCLGTRLVNTLFVLDEPSVGLHPRDTARLVKILQRLRDAGNTVVVVEHEPEVMRAANHLVDLGPGHGESGGHVVFEGAYDSMLRDKSSLTGKYLSGRKRIEMARRRPIDAALPAKRARWETAMRVATTAQEAAPPFRTESTRWLRLSGATRHNLKDLSARIPLERFVCVTGVSGSGKSTLVRDILVPALLLRQNGGPDEVKASDRISDKADDTETDNDAPGCAGVLLEGGEHLSEVVLVEQTLLGKTPRSTPAVYAGAFDHLRDLFAESEAARQRGLGASAFSFNSAQGQCERCRGAGFEKIEMQFLSDVFVRCPDCDGRRYRAQVLEATISPPGNSTPYSIADLLDATVDTVVELLQQFDSAAAVRALGPLRTIQEVGLGYLKLGQPINTLSGGESQRLKLVRYLAGTQQARRPVGGLGERHAPPEVKPILFVFDEPTTGLHFEDIAVLLRVFQRLVDAGHSLLVIEHNLEVIQAADWLIDLGPDAGDEGGQIVAEGTPETVAECDTHTAAALREAIRFRGQTKPRTPNHSEAVTGRAR